MNKKYVLITGASRGIGRACALAFAGAGYHVFLNSRQLAGALSGLREEILNQGGSSHLCTGRRKQSRTGITDFQNDIHTLSGPWTFWVNNAGISYFGLLSDMSDEEWRNILDTNLSSVFYCCRAAIPAMVSEKSGRIINISSMWGVSGASCEAAYSASKAGLNGLTKALAKELAPSNIQVNALACGVIDTAMNARLSPEEARDLTDEIPAGRFGTPEETARLVLMLADAPILYDRPDYRNRWRISLTLLQLSINLPAHMPLHRLPPVDIPRRPAVPGSGSAAASMLHQKNTSAQYRSGLCAGFPEAQPSVLPDPVRFWRMPQ